jgi:hypothetical protein
VWACAFVQTYDVWFRPILAFFIIDINAKEVAHVGVTRGPSEKWTAQQLWNATPFGQGPQFIIGDRDDKFGAEFDRAAKGVGTRMIRTAVKAPLSRVGCWRGCCRRPGVAVTGGFRLVPVPQSVPWLRFQHPLIEPDLRISRIRLAPGASRLRSRLADEVDCGM